MRGTVALGPRSTCWTVPLAGVLLLLLLLPSYAAATGSGPPVNTSVPAVKGTPKVGKKLTAKAGKWTGSKTITYSYQWQECDSTGNACTSIKEATGSSYTPTAEQFGDTLRLVVTASNSLGKNERRIATQHTGRSWNQGHSGQPLRNTHEISDYLG